MHSFERSLLLGSIQHASKNRQESKRIIKNELLGKIRFKEYVWFNTNKLLESGFIGIKTGHTDAAGPCLASCIMYDDGRLIFIQAQ